MSYKFPRTQAIFSSSAIQNNYRLILKKAAPLKILPMIKANGYGHGLFWVAEQLASLPNLRGFGVATLEEGALLRKKLREKIPIIVFSGCTPWTDEKGYYCQKHHLVPVLVSEQDWKFFIQNNWTRKLSYHLKFNTGMNRLGIAPDYAQKIIFDILKKNCTPPEGVLTHLACAETPNHPLSLKQKSAFESLHLLFNSNFSGIEFHFANSSAIWNEKKWNLKKHSHFVRPGLSLYGISPWKKASPTGLRSVIQLRAKVIARHHLQPRDYLGYGATFQVPSNKFQDIAILAAGYEDGVFRSLSDKGSVWLKGKSEKFLGCISMDMSAVSCQKRVKVGEWAEILGTHINPWQQAQSAGTIPYELVTSLSDRVERVYV